MNCNYKVNIKDIQNKYKFNIFAMGGYNDSDLRKMIESVFYALPRTTGTGTSVTLTDTAFSYLKNKLYATDTSQYTTTGKNLFKKIANGTNGTLTLTANDDGSYTLNGTPSSSANFSLSSNSLEAGDYSLQCLYSGTLPSNTQNRVQVYSSSQSFNMTITNNEASNIVGNKTLSGNASDVQFRIRVESGFNYQNVKLYPMLVKGTYTSETIGDFEPYTNGASPNPDYPQVIHTITGDNKIVSYNRNLWDEQYRNGIYDYASGNFVPNNTHTASLNPIRVKPNTTYYAYTNNYPIYISEYREDMSYIKQNYSFKDNTFTTSNECYYLQFRMDGSYGTRYNNDICINISDSDNGTYTKHQENSVILTLGDKEICKIGDYEDKIFKAIKGNEVYDSLASEEKATLDYGKWYLRKNIGKVVLNGSETWTKGNNSSYSDTIDRFEITLNDKRKASSLNTNDLLYCDNFSVSYISVTPANPDARKYECVAGHSNDPLIIIFINKNRLGSDDVAGFKTWLGSNNTIVYYVLATPTNELFNDTIQEQLEDIYNNMLSYEGQTNVSQVNDDLPFNINSTAIKDLNNL